MLPDGTGRTRTSQPRSPTRPGPTGSRRSGGARPAGSRPLPPLPPPVVDALVVVATAALVALTLPFAHEPGARDLDVLGWALGLLSVAPLVVRRRAPLVTLVTTFGVSLLYHSLDYSGGPPMLPVIVALYTAAERDRDAAAYSAALLMLAGSAYYRTTAENDPAVAVAAEAALVIGATMAGSLVRMRRAWRSELEQRLERTAGEAEARARQLVADERLHMARELHDVVAHTLAAITVHASAASETLELDPATARSSLDAIRVASKEATRELRSAVTSLRAASFDEEVPLGPAGTMGDLRRLADSSSRGGLEVELVIDDPPPDVSPAVSRAVYRVVQEALTNSVRHGRARRARIEVSAGAEQVRVEVHDDGTCPPAPATGGHGLIGMRERVAAVGGTFDASAMPAGGFRVAASIPWAAAP